MTGLDLFFHHAETLSQIQIIDDHDVARVAKMVESIEYDPNNIITYAQALTSFYNDIVSGLNTGTFAASEATTKTFSLYRTTSLPKFLSALTSRVFGCNGVLLDDYDRSSVEHLLTLLSLTKRIDSKETTALANSAGVESYRVSQTGRNSMTTELKTLYTLYWKTLLKEWSSCITWGDLGPGALLDKEFPFERHLALPALYGTPPSVRTFLIAALRQRFRKGSRLLTHFDTCHHVVPLLPTVEALITWLDSENCLSHPFVFAYRSEDQPSKLSVVEKSCLISRPITVTYGFKAILGACVRATGRRLLKDVWGIDSTMNVDDQTLSHQFLFRHYNHAFCADFRNGSGNFLHDDLEGSLPSEIACLERASTTRLCTIPNGPNLEPELVEAVTLQMGDSSCNFFLTASTFFLQIAALVEKRYARDGIGGVSVMSQHCSSNLSIELMRRWILEASSLCHCVGDDFIGLRAYYESFLKVTSDNHIEINQRKSSGPDGVHKETCGAWILNHGDSYTEIYPFRAPKIIPGYKFQTLLNCTQYLHKISGSEIMCRLMALTLSKAVKSGYELLSTSRSLDEIGNPYGVGVPLQALPINDTDPSPVTEEVRAFFFISQDLYPVLGKEGSRKKHQRFRVTRCTERYAPYCNLEDRGRFTAVRDKWAATHVRNLQIADNYHELQMQRYGRMIVESLRPDSLVSD